MVLLWLLFGVGHEHYLKVRPALWDDVSMSIDVISFVELLMWGPAAGKGEEREEREGGERGGGEDSPVPKVNKYSTSLLYITIKHKDFGRLSSKRRTNHA